MLRKLGRGKWAVNRKSALNLSQGRYFLYFYCDIAGVRDILRKFIAEMPPRLMFHAGRPVLVARQIAVSPT